MKESKVLVIGVSNCSTELARHLVLSGMNLELLVFKKGDESDCLTVGAEDYANDYLYAPEDAGKKVRI